MRSFICVGLCYHGEPPVHGELPVHGEVVDIERITAGLGWVRVSPVCARDAGVLPEHLVLVALDADPAARVRALCLLRVTCVGAWQHLKVNAT